MHKKRIVIGVFIVFYILFLVYKHQPMKEETVEGTQIVTSFYPMYIQTQALTKGTDRAVVNMASQSVGCLHDYQLTVSDMKKLYEAEFFIVNGLGSESFIEKAYEQNKTLKVINASALLEEALLEHAEDSHGEEASHHQHEAGDEHDHGIVNDHIWLSVSGARKQVEWISKCLVAEDRQQAALYEQNAKAYLKELEHLEETFKKQGEKFQGQKVMMVHETFYYLAKELGLDIVEIIPEGSYENASAKQVEELIKHIKEEGVTVLLTEEKYKDLSLLKTIAKETGCKVIVLDALLEEETVPSYSEGYEYVVRMKKNLEVLSEALSNE